MLERNKMKDLKEKKENRKINKEADKKSKKRNYIIISSIISVILVIFTHIEIDKIIEFLRLSDFLDVKIYWMRAILKLLIFSFPITLYAYIFNDKVFDFLSCKNGVNKKGYIFAAICFFLIFIAFYCIKDYIGMNIIKEKMKHIADSKINYIFISIYIVIVNAFLEETFFRGFLYIKLSGLISEKYANIFSSILFAIYHIGMVNSLSKWVFVFSIIGLFIVGFVFNIFNKGRNNIYTSYIVHASSNMAINIIGLMTLFF